MLVHGERRRHDLEIVLESRPPLPAARPGQVVAAGMSITASSVNMATIAAASPPASWLRKPFTTSLADMNVAFQALLRDSAHAAFISISFVS